MLLQDYSDIFSPQGPLAESVPHYRPRQAQLELAQAISETVAESGVLIAEAGTGTGKTWAYLVPVFMQGGKALVSTGTRTLQDQLFRRDIPHLRKALALPVDVALLKGRSNYVCHYHLERLGQDDRALKSRAEIAYLRAIQLFTERSRSGDKGELAEVPEDADIWHRVTSTRDNCLGQDCPFVRDCFVMKARRHAQDADVVVVNHALFMADLALREEGVTDLLPSVDLVVFDEAHQINETGVQFLGLTLSTGQLMDFGRDLLAAGLQHARGFADWTGLAHRLDQSVRDLRMAAGTRAIDTRLRWTGEAPEGCAPDAWQAALRKS